MASPQVSVIVLNWNGCSDTVECLESLQRLDYPAYEVIVVDNGSTDGSVDAIRGRFPAVKILETGRNLGYAGGNNTGLEYALARDPDFVLLLNNDTRVDAGLLARFVAAASDHPTGAFFSPKIFFYSEPTRIWWAGGKWVQATENVMHLGDGVEDSDSAFNDVADIDYACGCAIFARVSAIRRIGLLDERYFLVFEDVDWSYRALEAGYRLIFVPDARVWHKVSQSFGGRASPIRTYFDTRNRLLWGRTHLPRRRFLKVCRSVFQEVFTYRLGLGSFRLPRFVIDSGLPVSYARKLHWASAQYVSEVRRRVAALPQRWSDRNARAALYGARDFLLGRFGNPDTATLQRLK